MILCGGIGYRLKEETEFKPKPLIDIGGKPILWHIMKIYAHFKFTNFIIALGYKGNLIKNYFVNKKYYDGDFTLSTRTQNISHYPNDDKNDNFKITFADTGLDSLTGERVRLIKKYIREDNFMVTYGDGLADINIRDLVKFHQKQKTIATITGVNPIMRFGGFSLDKNRLGVNFKKRAKIKQIINGGFMVFKKEIFNFIHPNSMIEDVFNTLIGNKQLSIYKHEGFFHAMDTYQDMQDLNNLWEEHPAWKIWS